MRRPASTGPALVRLLGLPLVMAVAVAGCQEPEVGVPQAAVRDYSDRMMVWADDPDALDSLPDAPDQPMPETVGPPRTQPALVAQVIRDELRDPRDEYARVKELLETAATAKERKLYQMQFDLLSSIRVPQKKAELSLLDAIHRMLANNYAIRVAAYQPAIDTARVVEAEAAFDATFFFNFTNDKRNRPSSTPALSGTNTENRTFNTGIRKLLITGTQVEISHQWTRTNTDLSFSTINPAYQQTLVASARQPLLRNFGIDFNRSQINIRRNDRRISEQQLRRQIRDQLQAVEDAYWLLVQARRAVTIQAELITYTQDLYDTLAARLGFDVFKAQVDQVKAQLDSRKADFVRVINSVWDAQDELKRLMNDPEFDLATEVAIIPTDVPQFEPFMLDRLTQLQSALDNRSELKEAKLRVENARIGVGVAKNQALPRFDVAFTTDANGLGVSFNQAHRQLTDFDFLSYTVLVEFEVPIGNRAARAVLRQARLTYAQAAVAVRQLIEDICTEVNVAIRRIQSEYDQLEPRATSSIAARDFLNAIRAREQAKTPEQINTELGAQQSLASERAGLLQSLVDYNRAIINLERVKGTLLKYDNVVLEEQFDQGAVYVGP
jgi:outer membrane protein